MSKCPASRSNSLCGQVALNDDGSGSNCQGGRGFL